MPNYAKIRNEGMGNFLAPPGHPGHTHSVIILTGNHHEIGFISLESALENDDVEGVVRGRIRSLLEQATLVESPSWVSMVYGYFRNCYSPDGVERDVSKAITDKTNGRPPEHHLAVMLIRTYFPQHEPRLDLIANGGSYGTRPCERCGVTVQYDAIIDGWAPFGGRATCDEEGQQPHLVYDVINDSGAEPTVIQPGH